MYPLWSNSSAKLFSTQKISQETSQMTQIPISLNVINSCQNTMLQNCKTMNARVTTYPNDEPNISQV